MEVATTKNVTASEQDEIRNAKLSNVHNNKNNLCNNVDLTIKKMSEGEYLDIKKDADINKRPESSKDKASNCFEESESKTSLMI